MISDQSEINFEDPIRGLDLTALERLIANRIRSASAERPVQIRELTAEAERQRIRISARRVKDIVRTLRKDHQLPILARRERPFGYFWCSSVEEMKQFIETFSSQARDEFYTLGRVVRANYPELAGQLRLSIEG